MDEKTIFLLKTIALLSDEYESQERFLGCLLMALEELRCSEPEISRILSYTRNNIMTVTPEKAASTAALVLPALMPSLHIAASLLVTMIFANSSSPPLRR